MKKSIHTCTWFIGLHYSQLKQLVAVLMLALAVSPLTVNASGIYKWTDENGKVHYGSQHPEDAEAEKMKLHVPEPASQAESKEALAEDNQAELSDDAKAKLERVEYCSKERKRLQTIQQNKEIHQKDASGKVSKLSTEVRTQRLNKIKANIDKYCK